MFIKSCSRLVGLLLIAFISLQAQVHVEAYNPTTEELPFSQMEVIEKVNEVRAKDGLAPLTLNSQLEAAAQNKATDMAEQAYFSHIGPNNERFWDFITEADYRYYYAGENLAAHFSDVETLVNAWYNSPSHQANMLNAEYTETGIGITYGTLHEKEGWFVVQMFANPTPDHITLHTIN
tara:strand:+ start:9374 stop:9907 length:534 start_codon:yes stop_codon:yes gene_type:complete